MGIFDFLKGKKNEEIKNDIENEVIEQKEDDVTESLDEFEGELSEELKKEELEKGKNIYISECELNEEIYDENDIEVIEVQTSELESVEMIEEEHEEDNLVDLEAEDAPKESIFKKMIKGLSKTRENIAGSVENVFKSFTKIDEEFYEELEEALILADLGVATSTDIIEGVKKTVKEKKIKDTETVKEILADEISKIMTENVEEFQIKSPMVMLVIGVNGVGKTTSIGKLANKYKNDGKKVLLAAADTFRAAAIDQLEEWGRRSNIDVIKHQENSDPGAVVFDAIKSAKAKKIDILICDTAGRLHNKKNLMEELKKISKIINREFPEAAQEVLLVLDSTTGQNAIQQAKLFNEVADITGLILTKLDGTAKGGIVISIKNELNIPVRYIGIGEGVNDLENFNPDLFAKALFNNESNGEGELNEDTKS